MARGFRRRVARPRRSKEWYGGWTFGGANPDTIDIPVYVPPGQIFTAWLLDPSQALEFFDEPTILRTRINGTVFLDATSAELSTNNDIVAHFSMGLILWRSDFNSVTEAVGTDMNKDWIWFNSLLIGNHVSTGAGYSYSATIFDDVKSRRKVPQGYGVLLVVENFVGDTSQDNRGIGFQLTMRQLVAN